MCLPLSLAKLTCQFETGVAKGWNNKRHSFNLLQYTATVLVRTSNIWPTGFQSFPMDVSNKQAPHSHGIPSSGCGTNLTFSFIASRRCDALGCSPAFSLASSNLQAHNGEVVAVSSLLRPLDPLDPFLSSAAMENSQRPSAEKAKEYLWRSEGTPEGKKQDEHDEKPWKTSKSKRNRINLEDTKGTSNFTSHSKRMKYLHMWGNIDLYDFEGTGRKRSNRLGARDRLILWMPERSLPLH